MSAGMVMRGSYYLRPLMPAPNSSVKRPEIRMTLNVSTAASNYTIVSQSRDEMMLAENAPSVTMWPYLLNSAQTQMLNSISIYTEQGTSRESARLLYMNAGAMRMWRAMGRRCTVVGEMHRPPRTAVLSFGMPLSE